MFTSELRRAALLGASLWISACSTQAQGPLSNDVMMVVTDKGFEPQNIRVRQGQPVKLTITRKSDVTCATEVVLDEYAIKTALPLNQAVTVSFTPTKSGQLKYGCAMKKMVGGVISVE